MMEQECLLGTRFGVARHDQSAAIGSRKSYVQHLNTGQFFQHCPRSQSGSVHPQPMPRSEEHTSELQSLRHLVCRLLLEKKKTSTDTVTADVIVSHDGT